MLHVLSLNGGVYLFKAAVFLGEVTCLFTGHNEHPSLGIPVPRVCNRVQMQHEGVLLDKQNQSLEPPGNCWYIFPSELHLSKQQRCNTRFSSGVGTCRRQVQLLPEGRDLAERKQIILIVPSSYILKRPQLQCLHICVGINRKKMRIGLERCFDGR